MLLHNIESLIGNTPIIKLNKLTTPEMADVYVKLENMNLTGSIKIRAAYQMIKDAIESGRLKPGNILVEPTSGNTGIALAYVANFLGYKIDIVMPETMSVERRDIILSYNARLILTDGKLGMTGAIEKAEELSKDSNYVLLQQFENQSNVKAHYLGTGLEILNDVPSINAFVAGVGTGGTITGVGQRLKELNAEFDRKIKIIAVEPKQSAVLSNEPKGPHKIQGIGAGFIPKILDTTIYDEIIKIDGDEAIEYAKQIYLCEGLFLGISSAANILAAIQVAKKLGPGNIVVTIAADGGEKYLTNRVFNYAN